MAKTTVEIVRGPGDQQQRAQPLRFRTAQRMHLAGLRRRTEHRLHRRGHALSRSGYSHTTVMDNGHSLATVGDKTLVCQNSELGVITALDSLTITTLRTGLPTTPISYAGLGGEVWWSNGTQSGRCNADNTDSPWCVPTPANIRPCPPVSGRCPQQVPCRDHSRPEQRRESAASAIASYTLAFPGRWRSRCQRLPPAPITSASTRRSPTERCSSTTATFPRRRQAPRSPQRRQESALATGRFWFPCPPETSWPSTTAGCCRPAARRCPTLPPITSACTTPTRPHHASRDNLDRRPVRGWRVHCCRQDLLLRR